MLSGKGVESRDRDSSGVGLTIIMPNTKLVVASVVGLGLDNTLIKSSWAHE